MVISFLVYNIGIRRALAILRASQIHIRKGGGTLLETFWEWLLQNGMLVLRFLQPLLALLIVFQIFTSMRSHRRAEQPLILLDNLNTRDQIPVMYWENSIGRSKTSDIMLADPTVSRDHAVLYRREEGWLVDDTGSKSGVRVNGRKIDATAPVHIGDSIAVGTTTLVMRKANRPNAQKSSWFFDRRKGKRSISPAFLLFLVSFFHFLISLPLWLTAEGFQWEAFLPFGLVTVLAWIFFGISRRVLKRVNFELETLALFLSGTGIILIGGVNPEDTYTQIASLAIGMVIFCFILWFIEEPDRVMRWRMLILIGGLGLLALNLLLGKVIGGAQNWIKIGSFSFQPSEFVKIALIFVGTSTLNRLQTAKNMTEFIGFSALCIGALFFMGDFGTACIFFLTFLIISFIRSGDVRSLIFICAAAVIGVFVILQLKPYIANRFAAWGNVWDYADSLGYQQTRVLSYSASGGLFGMGIGQGELYKVAASRSDLVFGMLCEELGVLFAIIVAASIACLALYTCALSSTSRSTLYSIAACSAAGMLVFQSCLNIFGATDILPLTGVTLPFVSMGGSSMMAVWGLLAFIKASDERTYAARRKKA